MDVWVLTEETGSYSDYAMSVVAVATTAERAKALGDEYLRNVHADSTALTLERRRSWPEDVEQGHAHHLKYTIQPHRPDGCWTCDRFLLSPEEAWPLPSAPTALVWAAADDCWRAETDGADTVWTVFRMSVDRLEADADAARFVANDLNRDD